MIVVREFRKTIPKQLTGIEKRPDWALVQPSSISDLCMKMAGEFPQIMPKQRAGTEKRRIRVLLFGDN